MIDSKEKMKHYLKIEKKFIIRGGAFAFHLE